MTLSKEEYYVFEELEKYAEAGINNISLRDISKKLNMNRYKITQTLNSLCTKGLISYEICGYTVKIRDIAKVKVKHIGNTIVIVNVEKFCHNFKEHSIIILPIYVYNIYILFLEKIRERRDYEYVLYYLKMYREVLRYRLIELNSNILRVKVLEIKHRGSRFVLCEVKDIMEIKLI